MNYLCNDSSVQEKRRTLRKNQTDAECKIWSILKNKQMGGHKFYRQYSVGPYIIDFYCSARRLAVEVDGGQHAEEQHKQYDTMRSRYLAEHGVCVVRFWNNEGLGNIEGVWIKIKECVENRNSPHPSLNLREGD